MSEYLEAVTAAREKYHALRQRIDSELRQERTNRLLASELEVQAAVINAYANDERMAAIQRAYGTKDYNTIRRLVDGREAEIEAIRSVAAEAVETGPLFVFTDGDQVQVEGHAEFSIITLDGGDDLMLSYSCDLSEDMTAIGRLMELLDGRLESGVNLPLADEIFKAHRAR